MSRRRSLLAAGALVLAGCSSGKTGERRAVSGTKVVDGRPATTHWSSLDQPSSFGNGVRVDRKSRFVDDGSIVTAAGVSAGIDMALQLVARLDSVARAREVRRFIQYDPKPPV